MLLECIDEAYERMIISLRRMRTVIYRRSEWPALESSSETQCPSNIVHKFNH
jgi:hypothetical protein